MSLRSSYQEEKNQKVKVKINRINPYIVEIPLNHENICPLCRNSLDDICNECQSKNDHDTVKCTVTQGKCGHKFHLHCISRWTKNYPICPFPGCNFTWEIA